VQKAWVEVDGRVVGACGAGLVAFIGAKKGDTRANAKRLADRIVGMRIFNDESGRMNLSLKDLESDCASATGENQVLAVSNFTVYGDAWRSRRPSFIEAAGYEEGRELFDACVEEMRAAGYLVATGEFGAMMQVHVVNDGPVTIVLDA
jgi:D-tyrosyl-tRNA(Tyr) deacylase